jgi:sentrin-specific protease 1
VFSFDLMLVPINVGKNHWALGFVDFKRQVISYWDSLGSDHLGFREKIDRYLQDEWADKHKGEDYPFKFDTEHDTDVPGQSNGYDCGVFTCMFAECLARGVQPDFDQTDIKESRLVIALQISRSSILPIA